MKTCLCLPLYILKLFKRVIHLDVVTPSLPFSIESITFQLSLLQSQKIVLGLVSKDFVAAKSDEHLSVIIATDF